MTSFPGLIRVFESISGSIKGRFRVMVEIQGFISGLRILDLVYQRSNLCHFRTSASSKNVNLVY